MPGRGSLGQRHWLPGSSRAGIRDRHRPGHQADVAGQHERGLSNISSPATGSLTVHYVHNDLLADHRGPRLPERRRRRGVFHRQPGQGARQRSSSRRSARRRVSRRRSRSGSTMRSSSALNKRFSKSWFVQRQLHAEPAVRQLRGIQSSDEIRTPTTGVSSPPPSSRTAAFPAGRQRQPRVGHRRAAVRLARATSTSGPPGDRSPARGEAVWRLPVPVRHAGRGVLLRRQRHADHDLRQYAQLRRRFDGRTDAATWGGRRC